MSDESKTVLLLALIDRDPAMMALYAEIDGEFLKLSRAQREKLNAFMRAAYGAGVTAAKRRPDLLANMEALGVSIGK